MLNLLKLFLILSFTFSCQKEDPRSESISVAEKLGETAKTEETVEFVAQFKDSEKAKEHIADVRAAGGQADLLGSSDKIVVVNMPNSKSDTVVVPSSSKVVPNAKIKVQKRRSRKTVDAAALADNVMTAKSVVGVDTLRKRFPKADGHGVSVAVFDTGIDFGLRGVSDGQGESRKLKGFYDMTNFGRKKFTDAERFSGDATKAIKIGDSEIRFAKSMKIKKVVATGRLSEKELAAAYLAPTVDLNSNGKNEDTYLYVVGVNQDDELSVWVDVDADGQIKDRATEELTDFNTTGKYVLLRSDASPGGAKPLAVTINSQDELQFHSVEGGHGTSCAIVIGGEGYANGYLDGMAPKVQFLSYMLDVTGQDVYTMAEFMEMFLHAKKQKVDAISISWGFTVSNIKSARYFADFLDNEIASAGIVIGIANGNEGPAYSSGYTTDYMPHNGFAVGAMVSTEQAQNVYGWNGDVADSVIWYSSFGPTRGGRQMPDVISPLMTMVRGERKADGAIFRGFGGTSSATPALIGAVSAMMSQLKSEGYAINARLIKMAVMNTAKPIKHVDENRQGQGVINVDRAYDLYKTLIKEFEAARSDESKATAFAYELRAQTKMSGSSFPGEGLVIDGFEASKTVTVNLTDASKAMIDKLHFAEPLKVVHGEDFFTTNDSILLQATGATFSVNFDSSKLSAPGTYTDTIELRRANDDVSLLSIPVVVRVPYFVTDDVFQVDSVNEEMGMNDQWRSVISITEPTALKFLGTALDHQGGFGTYLGFFIANKRGDIVHQTFKGLERSVTQIEIDTPVLTPETYEIVMFRGGSRPAVVTPIHVTGSWKKPDFNVVASEMNGKKARVLMSSQKSMKAPAARLVIEQSSNIVTLKKDFEKARKGYYAEVEMPVSGNVGVRILQSPIDRRTDEFLNVSMAINNLTDRGNMYRGWINAFDENAPAQHIDVAGKAEKVEILAYPNIVNWDEITTESLDVELQVKLKEEVTSKDFKPAPTSPAFSGTESVLSFDFDTEIPARGLARIELLDKEGKVIETVKFEYR